MESYVRHMKGKGITVGKPSSDTLHRRDEVERMILYVFELERCELKIACC